MKNKIYSTYLTPEEKTKVKLLKMRISTAKSWDEVEYYKQELGLIMTDMIQRYSEDYNKSKRKGRTSTRFSNDRTRKKEVGV